MEPALIVAIGSLLVALAGYLGIARRASGKIRTSEAGQLWAESRAIREWARKEIERLEQKVIHLEERNEKLYLENGNLTSLLEEHGETIKELRDQVHRLSDENARLQDENVALRRRVTELEAGNGRS